MKLPPNAVITSGPVIIEDGKVLLNKEQKADYITPWLFPGGDVEQCDISLEEECRREVKEEMDIEVDIIRNGLGMTFMHSPMIVHQTSRLL